MADDIVTRLRDRYPDVVHPHILRDAELVNEAAKEIERLREKVQDLRMYAEQDACEIERLRTAGDALAAAIRNHAMTEKDVRAWEEVRRD